MPPPRRKYLGGDKLVRTPGNKFKCPNCPNNFNSHTEDVNHVKEIHKTTLLGLIFRQNSRRAEDLLSKGDSYKVEPCRELDRLINVLTRAEEKYLPLTEYGYPVKHLTQTILNKKVLAEREKVATTIKNLHKEVANLKNELIENNKRITSLNESHKKLLNTYESLLKNHAILKEDHVALLDNNSDYYVERCCLLEQENWVLAKRKSKNYAKKSKN
ncbi:3531_t:CDS:2 [Gigaspora rosea]|nr:3531_t:CDS:2 [Gigaspora rosea]